MSGKPSHWAIIGALAVLLSAAGGARAAIVLESNISVEGIGMLAVGNLAGTMTTTIAGNNARTDSEIQMKSRLVRMLAHNGSGLSSEIVRLDDDRVYHLDFSSRQYSEATFEQLRARAPQDDAEQPRTPPAIDESQCQWLPPKIQVLRPGDKARIAGFDSEHVTITAEQACKDRQTGSLCQVALGLDEWLTTGFAEAAEVENFRSAYALRAGLDPSSASETARRARATFSRYAGIWGEMTAKMQGVRGFPVKTTFTLSLGGEQCQNSNLRQALAEPGGDNTTITNAAPPSVLSAPVTAKPGAPRQRDSEDPDAAPASPPQPTATPIGTSVSGGTVVLVTISSQLMSVTTAPVSADSFVVPPDFRRQPSASR